MKLCKRGWVAMAIVVVAVGCGKKAKTSGPPPTAAPVVGGVAQPVSVDVAMFPSLEDGPPTVDDGRLEVRKPSAWAIMPRSKGYLVGFQEKVGASYPTITITAKDRSGTDPVSQENLTAFAKTIHDEQQAELAKGGHKLTKPVVPITVGDFRGAEVFRTGQIAGYISIERTLLITLLDGREYTVELRAPSGDTAKFRPYALAVASGLKRVSADAGAGSEPTKNP